MHALESIATRRTVRAFTAHEAPAGLIEDILRAAADAPTGGNMQPWQVAVVQGEAKRKLSAAYIAAAENMQMPQPHRHPRSPTVTPAVR